MRLKTHKIRCNCPICNRKLFVGRNSPTYIEGKFKFNCFYCQKLFLRYKSDTKNKKHLFCSKKCFGKWASKTKSGRNSFNYIDGRYSRKYYCKCGKLIRYNAVLYGSKLCKGCRLKELYKNPKNHPRWQGGISKKGYSYKFNESLRNFVRNRDNYTCQNCGMTEEEHLIVRNRVLSIHHIDYNKQNCKKSNLITLCLTCNVKANSSRDYWFAYFTYLMENIIKC